MDESSENSPAKRRKTFHISSSVASSSQSFSGKMPRVSPTESAANVSLGSTTGKRQVGRRYEVLVHTTAEEDDIVYKQSVRQCIEMEENGGWTSISWSGSETGEQNAGIGSEATTGAGTEGINPEKALSPMPKSGTGDMQRDHSAGTTACGLEAKSYDDGYQSGNGILVDLSDFLDEGAKVFNKPQIEMVQEVEATIVPKEVAGFGDDSHLTEEAESSVEDDTKGQMYDSFADRIHYSPRIVEKDRDSMAEATAAPSAKSMSSKNFCVLITKKPSTALRKQSHCEILASVSAQTPANSISRKRNLSHEGGLEPASWHGSYALPNCDTATTGTNTIPDSNPDPLGQTIVLHPSQQKSSVASASPSPGRTLRPPQNIGSTSVSPSPRRGTSSPNSARSSTISAFSRVGECRKFIRQGPKILEVVEEAVESNISPFLAEDIRTSQQQSEESPKSLPKQSPPGSIEYVSGQRVTGNVSTCLTLASLISPPHEISHPTPPPNSNPPLLTPHLWSAAPALVAYRPTNYRVLKKWERGYWRIDVSQWEKQLKLNFWNGLLAAIGSGRAGWCTAAIEQKNGDMVRVYCFGGMVAHVWAMLVATSGRDLGRTKWVDSGGNVVVET